MDIQLVDLLEQRWQVLKDEEEANMVAIKSLENRQIELSDEIQAINNLLNLQTEPPMHPTQTVSNPPPPKGMTKTEAIRQRRESAGEHT